MTRFVSFLKSTSLPAVVILLASATVANAQVGRSTVTGIAVDESGKAVTELELVLRPVGQTAGASQSLKTDKRGKFANRAIASGTYALEVKNSDRFFVKSGKVNVKDAGGILLKSYDVVSHPQRGFGTIPVHGAQITELELIVTSAAERDKLLRQVEGGAVQGEVRELVELVNAGDLERALTRGKEIMAATRTELPDVLHIVGATYARLQRYSEAEPLLRRAIELEPDQKEFTATLGTTLLAAARQKERDGGNAKAMYAEAEKWLSHSIEGETDPAAALLMNYASVLEKNGKSDQALAIMKRIADRDPKDVIVRLRMASLHRSRGEADKALQILNSLPGGGDPRAVESLYNVAVSFYNANDYESALAAAQRAAELDAKHAESQRLISRIYYAAGDNAKALAHLKKFVQLAPGHPEAATEKEMITYLEKTLKN